MAKDFETGERIKELRIGLDKTQDAFAKMLGVTQPTVSDWESPGKDVVPSKESYVKLGNIAPYPDSLWFWRQAGLDHNAMLTAAQNRLEQLGELAKSQCIAVPRLRRVGQEYKLEPSHWYVDGRSVSSLASAAYWIVEAESGLLKPGEVVLLDRPSVDPTDPTPFWGKVVLIDVTGVAPVRAGLRAPSPGLHKGVLRCVGVHTQTLEISRWYALLDTREGISDHGGFRETLEADAEPFGFWTPSMTAGKRVVVHNRIDAWERAKQEMRLLPSCAILGEVIKPRLREKK